MTKKEARLAREAWQLALTEGRIVRIPELQRMTSYPTIEAAKEALASALAAGLSAQIATE